MANSIFNLRGDIRMFPCTRERIPNRAWLQCHPLGGEVEKGGEVDAHDKQVCLVMFSYVSLKTLFEKTGQGALQTLVSQMGIVCLTKVIITPAL